MDRPQSVACDHVRYPDASFPFSAVTTAGVSPGFQRIHWHQTLEMNYIRKGSGYYLINGMRIPFQEGDIVLIDINDLHRAFELDNLVMDVITFDPSLLAIELKYEPGLLRPFREAGTRLGHIIPRKAGGLAVELEMLFQRMVEEYRAGETAYGSLIRADLIRFLGLMNRFWEKERGSLLPLAVKSRGMHVLRDVLHTMELNLGYGWTLHELAEIARLSPSRFSALFQQAAGTSPLNYLIQLRLTEAVHLLETTDYRIISIAEQCGFRNLSNFNRLFKHHIGLSPRELRDRSRPAFFK